MSKKRKKIEKKYRTKEDLKKVEEVQVEQKETKEVKVNKSLITKKNISWAFRVFAAAFTLSMALFLIVYPTKNNKILGTKNEIPYIEKTNFLPTAPEITAKSAIVVSTRKGKTYLKKNADLKLPPASTTKILTSLIAIHEFDLDEVVAVPEECTKVQSTKMGLASGELVTVETLLYGTLVPSAGDAACTLSVHKFSSGAFVAKMNALAQSINLRNTTLTNAIGLDFDETSHVSSAFDLYLMAREAMKNGIFRKIVGTKEIVLHSADGKYTHFVRSTNNLLFDNGGTLGVKTGMTERAKQVLVYDYAYKDDEIIIVVMGSDDRFGDTQKLLKYTLENYDLL